MTHFSLVLLFVLCRYPFNNSLHHHVESIILSCLESKTDVAVDYLLGECDLIGRVLRVDKNPVSYNDGSQVRCYERWDVIFLPFNANVGHWVTISKPLIKDPEDLNWVIRVSIVHMKSIIVICIIFFIFEWKHF